MSWETCYGSHPDILFLTMQMALVINNAKTSVYRNMYIYGQICGRFAFASTFKALRTSKLLLPTPANSFNNSPVSYVDVIKVVPILSAPELSLGLGTS